MRLLCDAALEADALDLIEPMKFLIDGGAVKTEEDCMCEFSPLFGGPSTLKAGCIGLFGKEMINRKLLS